ncbi:hypothetical protein LINPERHAP1_LOCUS40995, partial [Linum perenne]
YLSPFLSLPSLLSLPSISSSDKKPPPLSSSTPLSPLNLLLRQEATAAGACRMAATDPTNHRRLTLSAPPRSCRHRVIPSLSFHHQPKSSLHPAGVGSTFNTTCRHPAPLPTHFLARVNNFLCFLEERTLCFHSVMELFMMMRKKMWMFSN